ncbi:glycoside hydrolase [Auriculariales sp. MPI-PUGE-AT-0066]|nr:glycoside hydrolase [Auriculariales sp. MPI-PUGE-AT-0066]
MDTQLRMRGPRDLEESSNDHDDAVEDPRRPRRRLNLRKTAPYGAVVLLCLCAFFYFTQVPDSTVEKPLPVQFDKDRKAKPIEQKPPSQAADGRVHLSADVAKRDAVVEAFKHSWKAYERDAWGSDDYHPIARKGRNFSTTGGMGYMITDAIDTIHLMGLKDEFTRARNWIANDLSFEHNGDFSTFETTIRVLGGLLSTYYLTSDQAFLDRSVDLADRLMVAFKTPHGLPLSSVDLKKRQGVPDHGNPGMVSTAEGATLQLEFRYLSHLTDNITYWRAAEKVIEVIKKNLPDPPLVPIFMNYNTGEFSHSDIRLGSRADSYYEYLLKDYLQTGRTEEVYRKMYDDAMSAVHSHLVEYTPTQKLLITVELPSFSKKKEGKQDHLVCFLGGSLMLGATDGAHAAIPPDLSKMSTNARRDWGTGQELIKTCMETHKSKTGLSPEITHFHLDPVEGAQQDWYIKNSWWDARYLLRPETVESLFIAWRLTGDQKYRDWGWQVFTAIEKHAKIESGGYATVLNVDELPVRYEDKMETFFLAETLKYLFLLFEDSSVLPLTDVVFNTEAHPLPVFKPTISTGFA